MIKAGDRVIYNERSDYGECEGIPSLKTVEEVIETKRTINNYMMRIIKRYSR